jgi:dTDP-4-amino-4,6-dideoxygalactose transaminase
VRLVGATPVFADVDPDSGNITAQSVIASLSERTRAVIPVHLAGWPADMPGIVAAVRGRGIKVIEDCAQAHGAEIGGTSVGSFGDAAAFSFCQDKIISTAGEGGLLTFKDEQAWRWAWSFKDHGKNLDKVHAKGPPGLFRLIHDSVGTNCRLPGPQAAVGLIQLGKLDAWREARAVNAAIWAEKLARVPGLRVPLPAGNAIRHAFYKLYFYLEGWTDDEAASARAEILRRSAEAGLRVFSGGCSEIYLEQAFADLGAPPCAVSRSLGARSLMVEVHPTLRMDLLKARATRLAEIAGDVLAQG